MSSEDIDPVLKQVAYTCDFTDSCGPRSRFKTVKIPSTVFLDDSCLVEGRVARSGERRRRAVAKAVSAVDVHARDAR